jgi:mRNA-degrading endonuclease toxin of MazEF toxin-antitoxin module
LLELKKWDIISVKFGETTNRIDNQVFDKEQILNVAGINIRYEFSLLHMGVVITPSFLNRDNKILVIPITSFNPTKHNPDYINNFVLYKKYYRALKNNSVMLLNEIRSIDTLRITKKHDFHLKDIHKKIIKEKLYKMLINEGPTKG